jgi:serine/threonine protein phosphatase PrpC
MTLHLDDDDTTPTENATVLRELAATLAGYQLGVVDWGAATSPGMRRRVNEDAWGSSGDLFVIADGMGGRGGGAMAARTSIDRFVQRAAGSGGSPDWRAIVEAVNDDVLAAAAAQGIARVGTTLLASVIGGPLVTLVHLGDSRAYRLTRAADAPPERAAGGVDERPADRLDVLTHDHNVRAELLAAGLDVRDYRDRGVALHGLTSFIGLEHEVLRVDVLAVPVRSGDRILLCTDGVYRQLDDDQLRLALGSGTARYAAEGLVEQADRTGGKDNSTAVVVEVGVTNGGNDG